MRSLQGPPARTTARPRRRRLKGVLSAAGPAGGVLRARLCLLHLRLAATPCRWPMGTPRHDGDTKARRRQQPAPPPSEPQNCAPRHHAPQAASQIRALKSGRMENQLTGAGSGRGEGHRGGGGPSPTEKRGRGLGCTRHPRGPAARGRTGPRGPDTPEACTALLARLPRQPRGPGTDLAHGRPPTLPAAPPDTPRPCFPRARARPPTAHARTAPATLRGPTAFAKTHHAKLCV